MKKRILALVVAISVAMSGVISGGMSQTVQAAEASVIEDAGNFDGEEAARNVELPESTDTAESQEPTGGTEIAGSTEEAGSTEPIEGEGEAIDSEPTEGEGEAVDSEPTEESTEPIESIEPAGNTEESGITEPTGNTEESETPEPTGDTEEAGSTELNGNTRTADDNGTGENGTGTVQETLEKEAFDDTEEPEEEAVNLPTGLLPLEEGDVGIIQPENVFYGTEAILESETSFYGSSIYNNEWDKYSTNYYYNQMDSEERTIWDALDLVCLKYISGTQNADAVSGYDGEYTMEFVACGSDYDKAKAVARIFRYSNPQYYFLNTSLWRGTDGAGNYFLAFGIYPAFADGAARAVETAKVKNQAEEWLAAAAAYGTEEEKVRAIHDTIAQNVEYDNAFLNMSGAEQSAYETTAYTQSAYSVFCKDLTVCAGYAQTFEMLCNGAGIDCITVTSAEHQWNKVRVNDSWYNVDVTWADQSSYIYYVYFGRSDAVYDSDSAVNAAYHAEESFWREYLPSCSLDTNSTASGAGTFPIITATTNEPVIAVTYNGTTYDVKLTSATPGAVIYYTLDGEEPTPAATKSFLYTGAFTVDSATDIGAVAVCDAHWDSAVVKGDSPGHVYTISYVLNGGENSPNNPDQYSAGLGTIVLADPTRTGYTFGGWYSDESYTTRVTQITAESSGDLTLYAKWTGVSYQVAFNGNGSTSGTMSTREITYGSGKALPANTFKKTGYSFAGWNTKADGSGTSYADEADGSGLMTTAGATVTLYAQWSKTTYTITYNLNNGKNNSANPATYTITTATITLENPTRTGYTFGGWFKDSGYETKVTQIKKGSTGNVTLYAEWTANKYTISYNGNGNTSGSMSATTGCKYGTSYTLKTNAFKRTGYTFAGWNTKKDGSGKSYKNKESVKNLSSKSGGKVTLYAQWSKKKYTITYKLNNGKNSSKNPASYTITTATITLKKPTRTGYTFGGWYKDSKYKTKVTQIKKGCTGNITLYAKWTANKYSIVYNGNGSTSGKMTATTGCKYATSYKLKDNAFKRTGYKFTGWNTKKDGSGTSYANKASVKKLSSKSGGKITLYAQWKKVKYTITYKLNKGKNSSKNPSSYSVTTATIKLKKPTRKGYTFVGWYTDSKYKHKITQIKKGSTGNLTLYAKWKKK